MKPTKKEKNLTLRGQIVHWIGAQFYVCMFLDSRDKSLNMLKFCRNDQRKVKNSGSVLVAESAYNVQKAQFGLGMQININKELSSPHHPQNTNTNTTTFFARQKTQYKANKPI